MDPWVFLVWKPRLPTSVPDTGVASPRASMRREGTGQTWTWLGSEATVRFRRCLAPQSVEPRGRRGGREPWRVAGPSPPGGGPARAGGSGGLLSWLHGRDLGRAGELRPGRWGSAKDCRLGCSPLGPGGRARWPCLRLGRAGIWGKNCFAFGSDLCLLLFHLGVPTFPQSSGYLPLPRLPEDAVRRFVSGSSVSCVETVASPALQASALHRE